MRLPDLTSYTPHRTSAEAILEGVFVPGLSGEFFRRAEPDGERVATVGLYRYRGEELFMAWGYTDEEHCRWTAYRQPGDGWSEPRPGCPRVRPTEGGLLVGEDSLVLLATEPASLPLKRAADAVAEARG